MRCRPDGKKVSGTYRLAWHNDLLVRRFFPSAGLLLSVFRGKRHSFLKDGVEEKSPPGCCSSSRAGVIGMRVKAGLEPRISRSFVFVNVHFQPVNIDDIASLPISSQATSYA